MVGYIFGFIQRFDVFNGLMKFYIIQEKSSFLYLHNKRLEHLNPRHQINMYRLYKNPVLSITLTTKNNLKNAMFRKSNLL